MSDLTESQQRLLDVLRASKDHASYASVAKSLGIHPNAVVKTAKILERKGYIILKPTHSFFQLTDKEL